MATTGRGLPSVAVDYKLLQNAATLVDGKINQDRSYRDLYDRLSAKSPAENVNGDGACLSHKETLSLPDALVDQYELVECKCFLGLFPQISRAWMTIDSSLFLWNYMDGGDFVAFEELDQVIVSVALVKPIPGTFIADVKYLLVIATPIEIVLLGVGFAPGRGGLTLYPTQLSTSSDNVNMISIVGTEAGRIFLGGRDGHLRELEYQSEEGWFTRRCRTKNLTQSFASLFVPTFINLNSEDAIVCVTVDEERNILYTLSEKNVIQVFYLGSSGKQCEAVAIRRDIRKDVVDFNNQTPLSDDANFRILSLHPVSQAESTKIHLVAVTSAGVRLYFTTVSRDNLVRSVPSKQPTTLDLVHVRLLSSTRPLTSSDVTPKVHTAFYQNGFFLTAHVYSEEEDILTSVTMDPSEKTSMSQSIKIKGRTWSISEHPNGSVSKFNGPEDRYKLNELSTLNETLSREFICLTSTGLGLYTKNRPIDKLRSILSETNMETPALDNFCKQYMPDEFCAMCLAIACQSARPEAVVLYPTGGENALTLTATTMFFQKGGSPAMSLGTHAGFGSYELGQPIAIREVTYSNRHNGFYLYFARIVRPIWKRAIGEVSSVFSATPANGDLAATVLSSFNLLQGLRHFLRKNGQFVSAPHANYSHDASAEQYEKQSLFNLQNLLVRSIEALSFLSFLNDFHLPEIVKKLPPSANAVFKVLTFEKLVATLDGLELAKTLVFILMEQQISSGRTVDPLCETLLQRCPSFLSGDEVLLVKASEILQNARESSLLNEREAMLRESLHMFRRVVNIISEPKLASICAEYAQLKFHPGAVDLALHCAQEADPNDVASQYAKDGRPAGDPRLPLFKRREDCYKCILTWVLSDLVPQAGGLSADELDRLRSLTYQRALGSKDELFHNALYEWLLSTGQVSSTLLEIHSPYIETYLQAKMDDSNPQLDLLWKYSIKNEQFAKAAVILQGLADKESAPITFEQRLDYLTRALAAARSCTQGQEDLISHEFIEDLEAKLQVATIQHQVIRDMQHRSNVYYERINSLRTKLHNISDLYNDFTSDTDLHECNLAILHCSGYRNDDLVEKLWISIMEQARNYEALAAKMTDLALRFYPSDVVFPLQTICRFLELYSLQARVPSSSVNWTIDALHNANVPYSALFEAYRSLMMSPDQRRDPAMFSHLSAVMKCLIEKWLAVIMPSISRGAKAAYIPSESFSAKAIDEVLTQMINEPKNAPLSQELKELQRSIKRYFP